MLLRVVAIAAAFAQNEPPSGTTPSAPPAPQDQTKPSDEKKPQESPSRSQALEDLLRRLSSERGPPSVVPLNPATPPAPPTPPTPATPPPPVSPPSAAAAPETAHALLTRASDSVQVRLANGERRDLEWWDAHLDLSSGDEVRQGPKGRTIVEYPDEANYSFDGIAVYRLKSPALANPRQFELAELGRVAELHLGRGGIDTVVALPGGNELAGRGTLVTLQNFDLRALDVRNTGPEPIVVRCPYLGDRFITLNAGQHVVLPVLPEPSAFIKHLTHDARSEAGAESGLLVVQAPDEIALATAGSEVDLRAKGPIPGIARACGARVVLQPGEQMALTRAPLGKPRRKEWRD